MAIIDKFEELLTPEVVGGVLVYLVEASVTFALMGLFAEEEAMQSALMAAFTGRVMGSKRYSREAANEMIRVINQLGIGDHDDWYILVPYAQPAFNAFFKSAALALDLYRRL